MSGWPGKYVIGLTGNIATGKSVVRKMLEHLGAYGIDADALGHRAIAKGAPAYQPVLDTFGRWILGSEEQIDRSKLARIVFNDPEALLRLEAIVHPLVRQAVDLLIRRSKERVIVLEAIKLLESPLRQSCDSLWVTYAPPEVQLSRLVQKRGLTAAVARQRILAQPLQEDKIAVADIIINNEGSFEDAWRRVSAAWKTLFPALETISITQVTPAAKGVLVVEKARPRQASEIAALINRLSNGQRALNSEDVMKAFGEKAFLFLKVDNRPVGLVGWQVENLVARTTRLYIDHYINEKDATSFLINDLERASRDLQCEASLIFLPTNAAGMESILLELGYRHQTISGILIEPWKEAAIESHPPGTIMFIKQLRADRVLRPI